MAWTWTNYLLSWDYHLSPNKAQLVGLVFKPNWLVYFIINNKPKLWTWGYLEVHFSYLKTSYQQFYLKKLLNNGLFVICVIMRHT